MTGSVGSHKPRLAVLGAGSWGSALALLLARREGAALLWGRDVQHMTRLAAARENTAYLPGFRLPDSVLVTSELRAVLNQTRELLLAVPSHAVRGLLAEVARTGTEGLRVVCASKGFDPPDGALLDRVVAETLGEATPYAVVSGPTFAAEVAAGYPAAVTVAARDAVFLREVATRFHGERLRAYATDDVTGVQVGGAVKNVLAIAAGIADGLGFGANTRAALVTRGLAELMRLGEALGGRRETLMGLAGLGDLVLTCTDDKSRNRRYGLALASGASPGEAEVRVGQVVEGVRAARVTAVLAARRGVEMPIAEQVRAVVEGECTAKEAVRNLLARAPAPEMR